MADLKPRTREDMRKEAGERRVDPATLKSPREALLEQEAEQLRLQSEGSGVDMAGELTPGEEAEAEFRASGAGKALVDAKGQEIRKSASQGSVEPRRGILNRFRKQREAEAVATATAALHSEGLVDLLDSAWQDFRRRGYEVTEATAMTQAYVQAELTKVLSEIVGKL